MKKINLLYIGGSGRSGSTVLTKLLNFWNGFIGLNETCYLWRYGLDKNYPISNGELFSESTFWKEVLSRVFSDTVVQQEQIDFFSHTDSVGIKNMIKKSFQKEPGDDEARYIKTIEKLYAAILEVSGEQYIVDSSKIPDYAYLLSRMDNVNMFFVHLVRDPRGVAYSWSKKFKREDVQKSVHMNMISFGLLESTSRWVKLNLGCELMRRKNRVKHIRIRYEDFVQDPRQTLDKIATLLDLKEDIPRYHVTEEGFHDQYNARDISIWGNPLVRKSQGSIRVQPDNEWVNEFSFSKKLLVTLLTFPFLIRYRYPLFPAKIPRPSPPTKTQ